jgi:hypothetical protein
MIDHPASSHLAALLNAAAGPANIAERAGEDAAVDAYRTAQMDARRRPTVRSTALPWARAGAWIAAVAVAGTAGAALAAGVQTGDRALWFAEGSGRAPATPRGTGATPELVPPASQAGSPTANGRPAPPASLKGHCTAYLANGGRPDKALSDKALRQLAEAAGGPDRVAAYCSELVPGAKPEPSRPHPGKSARHRGAPSHRPTVAR